MSTSTRHTSSVRGILHTLLYLSIFIGLIAPAAAAEPVNTLEKKLLGWKSSGVAIRGYDTVAYFTEGKPVAGSTEHVTNWNGADWLFASAGHKAMFDTDPLRYAPQYGGYCAYGVAQGYLVKIEPEQWSIVDEKLYLNYDADVQTRWKADRSTFIKTADGTFTGLLN